MSPFFKRVLQILIRRDRTVLGVDEFKSEVSEHPDEVRHEFRVVLFCGLVVVFFHSDDIAQIHNQRKSAQRLFVFL